MIESESSHPNTRLMVKLVKHYPFTDVWLFPGECACVKTFLSWSSCNCAWQIESQTFSSHIDSLQFLYVHTFWYILKLCIQNFMYVVLWELLFRILDSLKIVEIVHEVYHPVVLITICRDSNMWHLLEYINYPMEDPKAETYISWLTILELFWNKIQICQTVKQLYFYYHTILAKKRYFLIVSPWNCRINTCNHTEQEVEFSTIWCVEGKVTNSLFARPFAIATIFKRRSKWRHDSNLTQRKKWWEKMGSDGLLDVCWISSTMLCKGNLICFWWFSTKNEKIFSTECRMLGWLCHVVSFICIFKTWKTGWNVELQNAQWFCKTCNLDSLFMVLIVHETWKNTRWQTNIAMKYARFQ